MECDLLSVLSSLVLQQTRVDFLTTTTDLTQFSELEDCLGCFCSASIWYSIQLKSFSHLKIKVISSVWSLVDGKALIYSLAEKIWHLGLRGVGRRSVRPKEKLSLFIGSMDRQRIFSPRQIKRYKYLITLGQ